MKGVKLWFIFFTLLSIPQLYLESSLLPMGNLYPKEVEAQATLKLYYLTNSSGPVAVIRVSLCPKQTHP